MKSMAKDSKNINIPSRLLFLATIILIIVGPAHGLSFKLANNNEECFMISGNPGQGYLVNYVSRGRDEQNIEMRVSKNIYTKMRRGGRLIINIIDKRY